MRDIRNFEQSKCRNLQQKLSNYTYFKHLRTKIKHKNVFIFLFFQRLIVERLYKGIRLEIWDSLLWSAGVVTGENLQNINCSYFERIY